MSADPVDQSLPRRWIIRSKLDFNRLFESGRSRQGRFVFVNYLPWSAKNASVSFRAAFVCGRKVGNAVERNRYKRRIREIIRRHKATCEGLEFIVVAKTAIRGCTYDSLRRDLIEVLNNIQEKRRP